MNIQSNFFFSILLSGALLGIPDSDARADPIDDSHQNNSDSRTWRVWGIEPGAPPHLEEGHQFRIQKAGSDTLFVPLRGLLTTWGQDSDFKIHLTKVNGPNPSVKILCGCKVIFNEPHVFRVFPVPGTKDEITVDYDHVAGCNASTDLPEPATMCQTNEVHGGTAHAEN